MEIEERVARDICKHKCLRSEVFHQPCVNADGSNVPCGATREQLLLTWRWDAAVEALRSIQASK